LLDGNPETTKLFHQGFVHLATEVAFKVLQPLPGAVDPHLIQLVGKSKGRHDNPPRLVGRDGRGFRLHADRTAAAHEQKCAHRNQREKKEIVRSS
jgi:hypothetical protein